MSSSLRDGTMSEAADDWLRQFVHDLRREDGNNRSGKAKDALAKGKFNNKNPCHVYWKAQFLVSEKEPLTKPDEHEAELNIWIKAVDLLHHLPKNEKSSAKRTLDEVDEWLILAYYRLIRCYNVCASRFTLRGFEKTTREELQRASTLGDMTAKMADELLNFTKWKENLDADLASNEYHRLRLSDSIWEPEKWKENPDADLASNEYHRLRLSDGIWEPESNHQKPFGGLYNKPPREFMNLMNNEHHLYQSKSEGEIFDVSNLEGNTLLSFFSNDANFWATSLLDRLEAIAPVSEESDNDGKQSEKESKYLKCWKKWRESEVQEDEVFSQYRKDAKKFSMYRKDAKKFSMLMELIFDLKDKNPKFMDEKESNRLREYAELAYLHCIIAVHPEERKKWEEKFNHEDDTNIRKEWLMLRATNGDVRDFLQASASERYKAMIDQEKNLGYALAGIARWLAHRTNGFYVALASNVQPGVLITDKTRREQQSSSWGEKVVLKNDTMYHQFISAQDAGGHEALEKSLDTANRFFNQRDQTIKDIDISRVCFGALQIKSEQIHGALLSEEWERAWKDKNQGALVKIFDAMVDFFLRDVDSPPEKALKDSVCLPRLDSNKEVKDRLMKAQGLDETTQIPFYLTDWIHGDEWGENFTVVHNATETRLYGIDLEDGLKRGSFDSKTKRYQVASNGGFHAQRLYWLDIPNDWEQGVPMGAFNGLSAVGRLLAALVQKSNSRAKTDAPENIQTLKNILELHQGESKKDSRIRLEKKAYHVVWLSFFDWLLHWTSKEDKKGFLKFDLGSFDAHLNAFVGNSDS